MFPPMFISHIATDVHLIFEFWIEQNAWISGALDGIVWI